MNQSNQPIVFNPRFVVELENTGALLTQTAQSIRRLTGISIGSTAGLTTAGIPHRKRGPKAKVTQMTSRAG